MNEKKFPFRLRWLALGLGLAGCFWLLYGLMSPLAKWFGSKTQLENVVVVGDWPGSALDLKNKVMSQFNGALGDLDLHSIVVLVSQEPAVAQVRVRRRWPSTLVLNIQSSIPILLYQTNKGDLWWLDANGHVIQSYQPGVWDINGPVLFNHSKVNMFRWRVYGLDIFQSISKISPKFLASCSELHVGISGKEAYLFIEKYRFPIYVRLDCLDNIKRFETLWPKLVPPIEYVDLTDPKNVYVKDARNGDVNEP